MSNILIPSIGAAGAVITATGLNDGFTAIEGFTADAENFRLDGVTGLCISGLAITPVGSAASAAKNTSATLTTYTGNAVYQDITHGASALLIGPMFLPDNGTLRIHWHQYVDSIAVTAPSLENRFAFRLVWDIGVGYVNIPNAQTWEEYASTQTDLGAVPQASYRNCSGSTIYQNTTGSLITITGIKLRIIPGSLDPADNVSLGEGTLISIITVL